MNTKVKSEIISEKLLDWYGKFGRKFPWRRESGPYVILITEVLLQKTRAEAVVPIFNKFFKKYPTIFDLARSDVESVKLLIAPLGLAYRSRRLVRLAQDVVMKYDGKVPKELGELLNLHGVGPYIASAVMCFGYDLPQAIVDVNVMRLLNRLYGITSELKARSLLSHLIPPKQPRAFNWALIDLAALICVDKEPRHNVCPLNDRCPKNDIEKSKWRFLRKRKRGSTWELVEQPQRRIKTRLA